MAFIQLKNVNKVFSEKNGNDIHAMQEINLEINQGDIFGIVGYSGAGKSTLVRTLNGLETPTNGEIIIDETDITQLKGAELRNFRKQIGMIFQHFNLLWSRTVTENIELPLELNQTDKKERQKRALELIKLVGLEGKENMYPSQLSGGQKQRVGIARALASEPSILLCDEATSALDPQTTDEVLDLLVDINQKLNLTIVLITHEMHVVRKICNKMAVMESGKIVETGKVLDVFRTPKANVTKKFVQQETLPPDTSAEKSIEDVLAGYHDGVVVKLTFSGTQAKHPVISEAIRTYPIDVNVIQGQIQQTQSGAFGTLLVQLIGQPDSIDQTISFFKEKEVTVEVILHG